MALASGPRRGVRGDRGRVASGVDKGREADDGRGAGVGTGASRQACIDSGRAGAEGRSGRMVIRWPSQSPITSSASGRTRIMRR